MSTGAISHLSRSDLKYSAHFFHLRQRQNASMISFIGLQLTITLTQAGNIYLFKFNNRNTRKKFKICSKLTIKTPERRHWCHSGVFFVNFEHIPHLFLVFLLLNLNWFFLIILRDAFWIPSNIYDGNICENSYQQLFSQKCSTTDVGQDPKHVSDPLSFAKMMLAENVQNNWRKFFLWIFSSFKLVTVREMTKRSLQSFRNNHSVLLKTEWNK